MSASKRLNLRIDTPPPTLRELALERMHTAIYEGQFHSGDRLVERTLCEQLGVSRSVVRETIRTLEAEGLVEIRPNKGPIVATLDWDQAQQIYDLRRLLEGQAAERCAETADEALKQDLKQALETLEQAYTEGHTGGLFDAITAFYEIIFAQAGLCVAWEVVQRLNGRISRLRALTLGTEGRHRAGFARITRIYQAIADNDPAAAREAIEEHIHEASRIARDILNA